jgi:hypothetical protein
MLLQVQEVGDGNINFVYIVKGPKGALCLKQGLPFVRIAQDWPLTQVPCPHCTQAPALPVGPCLLVLCLAIQFRLPFCLVSLPAFSLSCLFSLCCALPVATFGLYVCPTPPQR